MDGGGPEGPDAGDAPEGPGGLQWEPERRAGGSWLTRSPAARRMTASLAVADLVAITVALAVIATSLIRGRPTTDAGVLLAPGIPLLAAGQVWAILVVDARRSRPTGRLGFNAWRPSRSRSRLLPETDQGRSISRDLSSLFGPVDRRVTRIMAVLVVIGVLSFFSAIFFVWNGSPAGPGGGCAYRLMSHAVYTCVSETAYNLAGAGIQRIAAGIFLSFYAMHLYAALASAKPAQRAANGPVR
jgi:hypothetical protein